MQNAEGRAFADKWLKLLSAESPFTVDRLSNFDARVQLPGGHRFRLVVDPDEMAEVFEHAVVIGNIDRPGASDADGALTALTESFVEFVSWTVQNRLPDVRQVTLSARSPGFFEHDSRLVNLLGPSGPPDPQSPGWFHNLPFS